MPPQFSVLIPVFNAGSYLRLAIESVLGQTYEDWELIVLDDGSTDGAVQAQQVTDPRVRIHRQPQRLTMPSPAIIDGEGFTGIATDPDLRGRVARILSGLAEHINDQSSPSHSAAGRRDLRRLPPPAPPFSVIEAFRFRSRSRAQSRCDSPG